MRTGRIDRDLRVVLRLQCHVVWGVDDVADPDERDENRIVTHRELEVAAMTPENYSCRQFIEPDRRCSEVLLCLFEPFRDTDGIETCEREGFEEAPKV